MFDCNNVVTSQLNSFTDSFEQYKGYRLWGDSFCVIEIHPSAIFAINFHGVNSFEGSKHNIPQLFLFSRFSFLSWVVSVSFYLNLASRRSNLTAETSFEELEPETKLYLISGEFM